MYKMYKKDRGQWVEVARFNVYYRANTYARNYGFVRVDNANEDNNYYYKKDCWRLDHSILKEPLTDEMVDDLRNGETYSDIDVRACRDCGTLIGLNTNSDYLNIDDDYYCDSGCASNCGCFYCEDCEQWYPENVEYYTTVNGNTICENCRDESYAYCGNCGELYRIDDMHSDGYDYYCDDCYDEGIIKSYHSDNRPSLAIQRTEEDKPEDATFGTEIETECKGSCSRDEVATAVDRIVNKYDDLFVFEEDGSLSDEGYETISQPFTFRWFEKNQKIFQDMFNKMVEMGARSHDTTSCGFHVHIGRHFFGNRQADCIDRLIYLFEKYKPQITVFSRRKSFDWCEFPCVRVRQPVEWSKIDEVKKLDKDNFQGHHSAINLENYDTIEIRIFKGTLNFNTYYATLEFVNNLINYVKDKTDEEVEKGKFEDILNYLPTIHLKQYCLDRNII